MHHKAGQHFQPIAPAGQRQGAGGVLAEECSVLVFVEVAKHPPVLHMVAVEQGIPPAEVRVAVNIKKDAARQRKAAVDVGVQIGEIALALHHRVVDGRAVQRQPPADIGVDVPQLAEGEAVVLLRLGLEGQQPGLHIVGSGVHPAVVPQRIARPDHRQQHQQGRHPVQQAVRRPQGHLLPPDVPHLPCLISSALTSDGGGAESAAARRPQHPSG